MGSPSWEGEHGSGLCGAERETRGSQRPGPPFESSRCLRCAEETGLEKNSGCRARCAGKVALECKPVSLHRSARSTRLPSCALRATLTQSATRGLLCPDGLEVQKRPERSSMGIFQHPARPRDGALQMSVAAHADSAA